MYSPSYTILCRCSYYDCLVVIPTNHYIKKVRIPRVHYTRCVFFSMSHDVNRDILLNTYITHSIFRFNSQIKRSYCDVNIFIISASNYATFSDDLDDVIKARGEKLAITNLYIGETEGKRCIVGRYPDRDPR
jgi:hypothetical protein